MFALLNGLNKKNLAQLDKEGFKCLPLKVGYCPTLVDMYALTISCMLLPMSIVMWCIITLLAMLPGIVGFFYLQCLPRPLNRLSGRGFNMYCVFVLPFACLIVPLAYVWYCFLLLVAFLTGAPIALIRLIAQPGVIQNNFKILRPFWRGGAYNYPDSLRCHLGQADRHGFLTFSIGSPFLGGFASGMCHTPILKLFWTTNPLYYELEVAHINQWTPQMPDLTPHQVRHRTQTKIGRSKHRLDFRKQLDVTRFTPHYPFGPSNGVDEVLQGVYEPVVGSQYLNCHPKLYGHTRSEWCHEHAKMDSENGLLPVFRVYLDFFAYHFLTGYVELNVTKEGGLEHPMWCIVPKYGKLGRDMYSFVNILFLPYMKEALWATEMLVDDDDRDMMMQDIARRKSLRVAPSAMLPVRRRSSLGRMLDKVDEIVPSTLKHVMDMKETQDV